MAEHIRKQFADTEVRPVRGRVRRFTISTGAVDRDGDTINPAGWRLDNYRNNPTVLWAHDYSQLPLAKAVDIRVEGQALIADAEFADHDFANTVLRLVDGGFLRATSVGFKPEKAIRNDQRGGTDFIEQELLEFSIVPVPANPEAVRHLKSLNLWQDADVVLELSDEHVDDVLDIDSEDEIAAVRRYITAQATGAVTDVLRSKGIVSDPPLDPAARGYIDGLMRTAIREAIGDIVATATAETIARMRGRVD